MNTPHKSQKPVFEEQKQVRVTVPVAPDVLEAFQRLAAVSGMSTGKAMGEWLADTLDGVSMMTELLDKAKQAPRLAARELHAYAQGLTGLTSDLIEEIKGKSAEAAPGTGGKRSATVPGAASAQRMKVVLEETKQRSRRTLTPPVSNTGGKVPKTRKKAG
jgi:hypothetical protein